MAEIIKLDICYNLFEGGADGAGDGAATGDTSGNLALAQQGNGESLQDTQGSAAGDEAQVQEDKEKAYRDFIKANKDLYQADIDKKINHRFKETKAMESKIANQDKVLKSLFIRYGVAAGDYDALNDAIANDTAYIEDEADRRGLSVEEMEEDRRREYEYHELLNYKQQHERQIAVDSQLRRWDAEADALKERFPTFDMDECCRDPQFLNMLKAGMSVQQAYQSTHFDEFMRNSAAEAEKRIMENIRARGGLPVENAASSSAAGEANTKLTREQHEAVLARVRNGEKVILGK